MIIVIMIIVVIISCSKPQDGPGGGPGEVGFLSGSCQEHGIGSGNRSVRTSCRASTSVSAGVSGCGGGGASGNEVMLGLRHVPIGCWREHWRATSQDRAGVGQVRRAPGRHHRGPASNTSPACLLSPRLLLPHLVAWLISRHDWVNTRLR